MTQQGGTPPSEIARVRATAREEGALHRWEDEGGWFGRVVHERLRCRIDTTIADGGGDLTARSQRLIAKTARRVALGSSLAATCAQLGELAAVVSEGIAAPLGVPALLGSLGAEAVHTASQQVGLACSLAALYGVPFDANDAGEVAALLSVALCPRRSSLPRARFRLEALLAPPDKEILTRVGRGLLAHAALAAIPFAGVPWSAHQSYVATKRLGESAHEYARNRRAIRDVLEAVLEEPSVDVGLLLEGAWFLSACDGVVTHDELVLLAALARSIPAQRRPALEHLRFAGEGAWVMRLVFLDDGARKRTIRALETIAGLGASLGVAERSFLQRVGEALDETIDLGRVEEVRAHVARGGDRVSSSSPRRAGAVP